MYRASKTIALDQINLDVIATSFLLKKATELITRRSGRWLSHQHEAWAVAISNSIDRIEATARRVNWTKTLARLGEVWEHEAEQIRLAGNALDANDSVC